MATRTEKKAPRWEIDSIFPGGSKSEEYAEFRKKIAQDLALAQKALENLPESIDSGEDIGSWASWILELQELYERLHLASAFEGCLTSQDVNDTEAQRIAGEVDELFSRWSMMTASLESFSRKQPDKSWDKLISSDGLSEIGFFLGEMRKIARMKMPEELEKLALELAVNGYHAWNRLYDKMAGDLRVEVTDNGKKKMISLGQNAARLSEADRNIRKDAFVKMEQAWESQANLAAMALNFQAGFRLSIYKKRSWDSILTEPLINGRIKQETLDAMWRAVVEGRGRLRDYVDSKLKYLGIDKFCWYDQTAPVGSRRKNTRSMRPEIS